MTVATLLSQARGGTVWRLGLGGGPVANSLLSIQCIAILHPIGEDGATM